METAHIKYVPVGAMDPERFESILSREAFADLEDLIATAPPALDGRVIWNINSTAKGGGVAEMLAPLMALSRGAGVDARWAVIAGTPEFFAVTKRLHNHLHGFDGDGRGLGEAEKRVYDAALADQARELAGMVSERDIVILHDPQTAGLIRAAHSTGATVLWRCHMGRDEPNDCARQAWRFLLDDVEPADGYIFSREAFAWEGLAKDKVHIIHPSIDAFSPKNADQTAEQALAILAASGITPHRSDEHPTFVRSDGRTDHVQREADLVQEQPLGPDDVLVTQVSRWDALKDPLGVLNGFVDHVAEQSHGHLVLAGPSTASVADDPEGAEVWASIKERWHDLPQAVRAKVHLACLPMDDLEENAAIVNALQRHSTVVVQKSLAEGFGLTVAEAMWKSRPVVASRVGGIQDQIVDGECGVLISDPHDLRAFGSAVVELVCDHERARKMGDAARQRIADNFLPPAHLRRYVEVFQNYIG